MTEYNNIHRYLDDAFGDVPRSPENQDLKEELRGNLAARAAELEAGGMTAEAAAARAINDLGDIRELIEPDELGAAGASTVGAGESIAARLIQLNRVRVDPKFVVRIVSLSVLLALTIAVVGIWAISGDRAALDFDGLIPPVVFVVIGAVALGALVALSLRHETSQHFAMPLRRALRYGLASAIGLVGLEYFAVYFGEHWSRSPLGFALAALLVSAVLFIKLGVTQTNRSKPWVKELQRSYQVGDRFSQDPAAAARFGMYTVVIWVLAIAAFIVLSILTGFAWSWLALVAGLVVFLLVLARMLFPAHPGASTSTKERG